MNWLGTFYQWFWFHTEFWLTPVNRRPYTFIMRDWLYAHQIAARALILAWYALMGWLVSSGHPVAAVVNTGWSMFLLAHLVWGTKWIEHQQEYPEYLGTWLFPA